MKLGENYEKGKQGFNFGDAAVIDNGFGSGRSLGPDAKKTGNSKTAGREKDRYSGSAALYR